MKRYFSVILFVMSYSICTAEHIVGGEIYYECKGNDNYEITLQVFRDCAGGGARFDAEAVVSIYDKSDNLIENLKIFPPAITKLDISIPDPCFEINANVCVESGVYKTIVNLPPIDGGYTVTYQRCCRNKTIQNMASPGTHGTTFTTFIPDANKYGCNNAPQFKELPPLAVCLDSDPVLNLSATDIDGDSLVYIFCQPLIGAGTDGINGGNPSSFTGVKPDPASPPPYSNIPWLFPFNPQYPIPSNPGFSINPIYGKMRGKPNIQGQYAYAICIEEYRNGELLATHRREYQINIITCPTMATEPNRYKAKMDKQFEVCDGFEVDFTDKSTDAKTWHWDFGVLNILGDTSDLQNPTYTFPDSGNYEITLIINPNTQCSDTTKELYRVYPLLNPYFEVPDTQCFQNNSFDFTADGSFQSYATINWKFGLFASKGTSNSVNESNISYSKTGSFSVELSVLENGCMETYVDTAVVLSNPNIDYSVSNNIGCAPFFANFQNQSNASTRLYYNWDLGNGLNSEIRNPSTVYLDSGVYPIHLMIYTKYGCIDTLNDESGLKITVYPSPTSLFSLSNDSINITAPQVEVYNYSDSKANCTLYYGDGESTKNCEGDYAYSSSGKYLMTQVVTNEFGCSDTSQKLVIVSDVHSIHIPNAFTPNNDGLNDVFLPQVHGTKEYLMTIIDRWGNTVFSTINSSIGWNGNNSSNNSPCESGIYQYFIQLKDINNQEATYSGSLYLLR